MVQGGFYAKSPGCQFRMTRARSGLVVIGNLHHLKKASSWKSFIEATDNVPVQTPQYAELLNGGPISAAVLKSLETEI
ncbi:hypothetical protein QR680_007042 [Steinernema hermaphroditum]|uniref:Uncharacterized protein n=1 Tax=Steinernema hermaphroditum TaxID=289476 RepID=A0AA39LY40_9BILA|nr:hypothetical protein QR680_007042 [Steinernema hermaphroditum]